MSAAAATVNRVLAHSGPARNDGTYTQSANADLHDKVLHQFAQFETSRRMIACLVNEGMIGASVDQSGYLNLRDPKVSKDSKGLTVRVGLTGDAAREWLESTAKPYLQPSELSVPVMIRRAQDGQAEDVAETDPTVLFTLMAPWFISENTSQDAVDTITRQLKSSAENQEEWFHLAKNQCLPTLADPAIVWEQSILTGHPTHPMHRSCFAQEPLDPVSPKDVQSLRNPEIKFLAVPSSDLRITGAFQSRLLPLLQKLGIANTIPGTVVVPCLKRQIPAITSRFPRVEVLQSPPVIARAQAATRTVSLAPELDSPYHLKLALACFITSALRTVSPWTACVGPEAGDVLSEVLPENLWVAREVASVTGSGADFDEAKHISCVLREDLEPRANALGEALIPAAALAETDLATGISSAERVFGLDTIDKRREWLRSYVSTLLRLVIPPALVSGVALEAHGQNMLVRVNKSTKEVTGFVVRDFGGIKIHMPTLRERGYTLYSALPDSFVTTDVREEAWDILHHTLFNNNINHLIQSLGLHRSGGWAIVREELNKVISESTVAHRKELLEYLSKDQVHLKCFLKMKLEGLYRDYLHVYVPNLLQTQ
ncbi:hypothetical protein UCDDA912_g05963 [Diaporthe ampelina]|uniref:Uncharacterized protein n=1 Tax=Diaporthe ampelina TaxID=1214573 RepID=A0A0G2FIX1_9PEZI|nr:hypothetical protein UCDDA912_g05963 [Diaporthe ampelina]